MRTHALWKVITHMALARGPTSADTRSRISAAALLVKVIASTWPGCTARAASRWAIRWVSTRVLPGPGTGDDEERPALVQHGLALLGVQAGEQLVGVGARPPGGPAVGAAPGGGRLGPGGHAGGVDQGRVGARVGRRVDVRVGPRLADVEAVEEGAHVGPNPTWRHRPARSRRPAAERAATWGGRGHHRGPGRRASSELLAPGVDEEAGVAGAVVGEEQLEGDRVRHAGDVGALADRDAHGHGGRDRDAALAGRP